MISFWSYPIRGLDQDTQWFGEITKLAGWPHVMSAARTNSFLFQNSTKSQWRSQKFSTGGASICSIPFCPFPFSCPTKSAVRSKNVMTYHTAWMIERTVSRPITLRNHIPKKLYISLTRGAYAHYASCMATPLQSRQSTLNCCICLGLRLLSNTVAHRTHGHNLVKS